MLVWLPSTAAASSAHLTSPFVRDYQRSVPAEKGHVRTPRREACKFDERAWLRISGDKSSDDECI